MGLDVGDFFCYNLSHTKKQGGRIMENQTMYESARSFARRRIISERQLREMIASGKVPGIKTARGFKINVGQFLEKLDTMSRSAQQVDL